MVFYLQQNPDVKETLDRLVADAYKASQKQQPLTLKEVKETKVELSEEVKAALEYAETVSFDTDEEELAKDEILKAVRIAVKAEWNITPVKDGKYEIDRRDGQFTRKGLDEYYTLNIGEAKALIEELKANGIWK